AHTNPFYPLTVARISHDSGVTRYLVPGTSVAGTGAVIDFLSAATASDGAALTALGSSTRGAFSGSEIHFYDSSTAASATIAAEGARAGDDTGGGVVFFHDNSTSANANLTATNSVALGGGSRFVIFADFSSASAAIFNVSG